MPDHSGDTRMRISVILAAYHSDATLGACLDALESQSLKPAEIIVVNSSQEERTAAIAARYPKVVFVQSPQRLLPHAARNVGARRATGDVLVFSDPDCVAAPDWLERLNAALELGDYHAVVGGAMGLQVAGYLSIAIHLVKFHWLLPGLAPGQRWILPTANVAYPRAIFEEIGPFEDDLFSGDAILSWRATSAGFPLRFEPKAVVSHQHSDPLIGFLKQRFERGSEFLRCRSTTEKWSTWRRLAYCLATPLLGPWVMLRAAVDAQRAGWTGRYLSTLPIQLLGHTSWTAGEATAALRSLRNTTLEAATSANETARSSK